MQLQYWVFGLFGGFVGIFGVFAVVLHLKFAWFGVICWVSDRFMLFCSRFTIVLRLFCMFFFRSFCYEFWHFLNYAIVLHRIFTIVLHKKYFSNTVQSFYLIFARFTPKYLSPFQISWNVSQSFYIYKNAVILPLKFTR